jgi:Leucine-rich repeat (LRR) protein
MDSHPGSQAGTTALPVLSPTGAITPGRLLQIAKERLEAAERVRSDVESVDSASTEDNSVSLQLDDLNIANIPLELIEFLHHKISKLSVRQNWLVGLPTQFVHMERLTYLNIAQNHLGEVPPVVCYLPSLEILDISGNQIRRLPKEIANLSTLRVLSMANNRFEYLPAFIADIPELTYLEFYGNPIIFPPPEVVEEERAKHGDDVAWIRQYLNEHKNQIQSLEDSMARSWPARSGQQNMGTASSDVPSDRVGVTAERSRSNSEATSLRAAKRMGFVASRKQRTGSADADAASNSSSSAGSASIDIAGPSSLSQQHARIHSIDSSVVQSAPPDSTTSPAAPLSVKRSGGTAERPRGTSVSTSPLLDSAPGAYFRRLSTLQEDDRITIDSKLDQKILDSIRKILYSVYEFHDMLRRCSMFCTDKSIAASLSHHLRQAQQTFPDLVKALENPEASDGSVLLDAAGRCMDTMSDVIAYFKANIDRLTRCIDIKFVRSLIMVSFTSFHELHNAWTTLYPHVSQRLPQAASAAASNDDFAAADDHLYERIYIAAQAAQSVLGQLTSVISRNAAQASQGNSLGAAASDKIRELGNVSLAGMDVTRRLKSRMEHIRETGQIERKRFWDDANAFLKSVISILSSTKSLMNDVPFLVEVRPNLTTLTRVAKEIPLLLELSSYRTMMSDSSMSASTPASAQTSIASQQPQTLAPQPLLATPLTAVLGPAAQAVMSPTVQSSSYMMQSPFIPSESTMTNNDN